MAGVGTGVYKSFEEAGNIAREVIDVKRKEPNPRNSNMYDIN